MLEAQDIERVRTFLDSRWSFDLVGPELGGNLLPALMDAGEKELAAKLFSVIIDYRWEERGGQSEPQPLIDAYWLNEIIDSRLEFIAQFMPLEGTKSAVGRIESVLSKDPLAFHVILIPSIEQPFQEFAKDRYQSTLVRIARDCLVAATQQNPDQAVQLIQGMLAHENDILKRIAIYVIASVWEILSPLFWEKASSSLMAEPYIGGELRRLTRLLFHSFSDEQKKLWLEMIESAPYYLPDDLANMPEQEERYLAGEKLNWLSPIKDNGYAPAARKYEEYLTISGTMPVEDITEMVIRTIPLQNETDSLTERLTVLDAPEIAELLKDLPSDLQRFERRELDLALKQAVQEHAKKFDSNMAPFLDVDYGFVHSILWGLTDAWKAKSEIDWRVGLTFCKTLLDREVFWSSLLEEKDPARMQVISQIANLINEGVRDGVHAFESDHFPLAEAILFKLLSQTPSKLYDGYSLSMAVLNSALGDVLRAVLNYSLNVARQNKELPENQRWLPAIRREFTERLDLSRFDHLEFSFTVGQYLPNLYYLDKNWIGDNINRIFPKENEPHWKASFSGYLMNPNLYREIYDVMRANGHYANALVTQMDESELNTRLIQHLCIEYLEGGEPLGEPDSLFEQLITQWDASKLDKIVWYYWTRRKASNGDERQKIVQVWDRIFAHYEENENLSDEELDLFSNLARLTPFLESIDERSLQRLRRSVKLVERKHNSPLLVEYLRDLAEPSPEGVTQVYIEMFNSGIYPDFDKTNIIQTVEAIYQAGRQEQGDSICNSYLMHGYDFLRGIYNSHHQDDPPPRI